MNTLNIGRITPEGKKVALVTGDCPQCGAGKDQRVDVGGFGCTRIVCQTCAYQFKENER
jgi:transposase-like protein